MKQEAEKPSISYKLKSQQVELTDVYESKFFISGLFYKDGLPIHVIIPRVFLEQE